MVIIPAFTLVQQLTSEAKTPPWNVTTQLRQLFAQRSALHHVTPKQSDPGALFQRLRPWQLQAFSSPQSPVCRSMMITTSYSPPPLSPRDGAEEITRGVRRG